MSVLAIDPGTTQSAVVHWDGKRILRAEIMPNEELVWFLERENVPDMLLIEWIESYGMAVGKEVFITCRWCGRFEQAAQLSIGHVVYIGRKAVKSHHCHSTKATDANIRQALVDRFGPPGKKKTPGLLYPLNNTDLRSAFALAVYWWDEKFGEQ